MDKITTANVEYAVTSRPVAVSPDDDIDIIAILMVDKKIHTIPVIDANGGIVGKEDVLKILIPK
ncbi:MAG: CBS domain-containing protein [Syntrophaceae bacterium]